MIVDLRSDTVTKPTDQMRAFMMQAEVGDDVFGEDPSINLLEERIKELFGTEAAMFCPSATMANQIALKLLTQPLDEIICDRTAHIYNYEVGGYAFHSGCSIRYINGEGGVFTAQDVKDNINPVDVHKTITSLVCIENTVNRGGGKVFPLKTIQEISEVCKEKGLHLHMDGSRIFNAMIASGANAHDYGKEMDTISICLSKGLGCPVGAILTGKEMHLSKARRIRKVFGGGLRQAGILAAAGIYALEHHIERLAQDHQLAKQLAKTARQCNYIEDVIEPETNILIFKLGPDISDEAFISYLHTAGVLAFAIGGNQIRFVTHLNVASQSIPDIVVPAMLNYNITANPVNFT